FDRTQLQVEDTAFQLDANRLADNFDGDAHARRFGERQSQQVGMQQASFHGVNLPVFNDDGRRLAAVRQRHFEDGVMPGIRAQDVGNLFGVDDNGNRYVAAAIDRRRDQALRAQAA